MNKYAKIILGSLILDAAIFTSVLLFALYGGDCPLGQKLPGTGIVDSGINQQALFGGEAKKSETMAIASGIVPHHLLAEKLIRDFFKYASLKGKPDTVVLLSPDHFNAGSILGRRMITVGSKEEYFRGIRINGDLLTKIGEPNNFIFSDSAIALDHGLTNLAPFIKEYFPETKIVPAIIPFGMGREEMESFTESLNRAASPNTLVIASVDFSHYLPSVAADLHDVKSIRVFMNFEKDNFSSIEADSWQALYVARYFAELKNKTSPNIIGHYNSDDFAEKELFDGTVTSYFSVVFGERSAGKSPFKNGVAEASDSKTLLFAGDIMLDRGVEYFTNKNNDAYPYKEIKHFLKGVDIVFGNLEGPIVKKPLNFADDSLRFAFSSDTTKYLGANFDIVSLANNHTLNMGQRGLEETRNFLREAGISAAGDPLKCAEDFFVEKDGIVFLAFNKTFPLNCGDDEIIKTVKSARETNPEKFMAISIHWGNEYQLKSSSRQKKLAHKMIDAGADLIIGQHPHVVQEIERYKNKMIFYSLGNFIFDQSFSKETQEGLAVGAEINSGENAYFLFPIRIKKGQPFLMEEKEANKFLGDLSLRTSADLSDEVKLGIIKLLK